jgi:hypothetical protein
MSWTHHVIIKYLKAVHSVAAAFLGLGIGVVFTFALDYLLRYVRRRWPDRSVVLRHILGICRPLELQYLSQQWYTSPPGLRIEGIGPAVDC